MRDKVDAAYEASLGAEPAWPDDEPCSICAGNDDTECGNCEGSGDDGSPDGRCFDCGGFGWRTPDHCCRCGGTPYCRCSIDTEPGPGENPDAWCGYCQKAGHWSHEHATDGELAQEARDYEANQSPKPPQGWYEGGESQ